MEELFSNAALGLAHLSNLPSGVGSKTSNPTTITYCKAVKEAQ